MSQQKQTFKTLTAFIVQLQSNKGINDGSIQTANTNAYAGIRNMVSKNNVPDNAKARQRMEQTKIQFDEFKVTKYVAEINK